MGVIDSTTVRARQAADAASYVQRISELPIQKYVRDALIFLHSETTNDVARLRIAEALAGYRRGDSMGGE